MAHNLQVCVNQFGGKIMNELFIALDDAAKAYEDNYCIDDVEKAINDDYGPSLVHKVFESEDSMRGFQDGLDFCSENCGCMNFWVIVPNTEEERSRLINLAL